ncbi:MAG: hypothetical protein EBR88_08505, partial [Betaproteobacteria bacterium]|nr:hypothetical protein [Betaproteobacteria bacterium]
MHELVGIQKLRVEEVHLHKLLLELAGHIAVVGYLAAEDGCLINASCGCAARLCDGRLLEPGNRSKLIGEGIEEGLLIDVDEHVVCVFGDAALTNGVSFEALNNISHTTKKFIGILNDNEWSIAKNVGAIAEYLGKLTASPGYNRLARDFTSWLRKLPRGEQVAMLGAKAEEALKGIVGSLALEPANNPLDVDGRGGHGSALLFEEFGLRYLGPIDGHNIPLLVSTLEFAKTCNEPVVIHVLTQKGKGYEAALKHPEKFHGLGSYDAATGQ